LIDVREDGFELRGAGGCGAGIVEHVYVPDPGDKSGDWRAIIIPIGLVVNSHPVLEGCESGVVVVVRIGRDGRSALLGLWGRLLVQGGGRLGGGGGFSLPFDD
jgi:hypothetical protein